MKASQCVTMVLVGAVCLSIFCGCTENPFSKGDISSGAQQIRGKVALSDGSSPGGVYVWLEGFNIGTYTDQTGQFQVILPLSSQDTQVSVSGVFNLYFYVANYKLASSEVVVRNGEFLYSRGDINRNGELNNTKSLLKLLNISTLVEPASVTTNFEGLINVQVTLQATFDSVTVVFPKMVGDSLGAILIRGIGSGDIFVDIPDIRVNRRAVERIGPERRSWCMVFNLSRGALPKGQYEIIPYFLIEQENMPAGLLASLGPNVEKIGPDYLKIPFKREGGHFEVASIVN